MAGLSSQLYVAVVVQSVSVTSVRACTAGVQVVVGTLAGTGSPTMPGQLLSNIHVRRSWLLGQLQHKRHCVQSRAAALARLMLGPGRVPVLAQSAYSAIDRGFFLRNEFVECLAEVRLYTRLKCTERNACARAATAAPARECDQADARGVVWHTSCAGPAAAALGGLLNQCELYYNNQTIDS